ncbi:MAG: TetR/AcrR family transcriptional regulator [Idiomarina sp.]|nr:TetR/AcrR family transcriptional regulator [Idiomarina sp.]
MNENSVVGEVSDAGIQRGHRLTRGGRLTREGILNASKNVLRTVGFSDFSTPKVAKAAGISQGNLTYYFPTRDELLIAVVESLLDEYASAFRSFVEQYRDIDEQKMAEMVEWLLDDAVTDKTAGVIPQLWALSTHNEEVARVMHRLYDIAAEVFAEAMNIPPASPYYNEFIRRVYLLSTVVEGATAIHVTRSRSETDERFLQLKAYAVPHLSGLLYEVVQQARTK